MHPVGCEAYRSFSSPLEGKYYCIGKMDNQLSRGNYPLAEIEFTLGNKQISHLPNHANMYVRKAGLTPSWI